MACIPCRSTKRTTSSSSPTTRPTAVRRSSSRCGNAAARWYLYCSHLWHCGWSVFEVTDPYHPELLKFSVGPENTWTIQVAAAEGKLITGLRDKNFGLTILRYTGPGMA